MGTIEWIKVVEWQETNQSESEFLIDHQDLYRTTPHFYRWFLHHVHPFCSNALIETAETVDLQVNEILEHFGPYPDVPRLIEAEPQKTGSISGPFY